MRSNRIMIWAVLSSLALSACGETRNDMAVAACRTAIMAKLGHQDFRIDEPALAKAAKVDGSEENTVLVEGSIVFEPGLPREYTQSLGCRVRFAEGAEPVVTQLTFTY